MYDALAAGYPCWLYEPRTPYDASTQRRTIATDVLVDRRIGRAWCRAVHTQFQELYTPCFFLFSRRSVPRLSFLDVIDSSESTQSRTYSALDDVSHWQQPGSHHDARGTTAVSTRSRLIVSQSLGAWTWSWSVMQEPGYTAHKEHGGTAHTPPCAVPVRAVGRWPVRYFQTVCAFAVHVPGSLCRKSV